MSRSFQKSLNRQSYAGMSDAFNSSGGLLNPTEEIDPKESREARLIRQQYEQMLRKEEKEQRKKERLRLQKMEEGSKDGLGNSYKQG